MGDINAGGGSRCVRIFSGCFARPEDSESDVQLKLVFVVWNAVALLLGIMVVVSPEYDKYPWLMRPTCAGSVVVHTLVLLRLVYTRKLTVALTGVAVAWGVFGAALLDVIGLAVGIRSWSLFVLYCDSLLVLGAPDWMSLLLVSYVLVHLAVCQAELDYRFGLIDIEVLKFDREILDAEYGCADPPCANGGFNKGSFALAAFVFCLDYHWTRGFAGALRKEKEAMVESIALAQAIAECLAKFDLSAAEKQLTGTGKLPQELYTSYHTLLDNLASYRPYLPQSVLPDGGESESEGTMPASPQSSGTTQISATQSSNGASGLGDSQRSSVLSLEAHSRRHSVPAVAPLKKKLQYARCTQVHVSTQLDAALDHERLPDFLTLHQSYVSAVVAAANACRGIVDTFDGGAITMSFNASRPCVQHPRSAAAAVASMAPQLTKMLGEHGAWCGGIATGPAFVGILGTALLRRPSVVGALPHVLGRLVRVAEHVGAQAVLANGTFFADQSANCEMRIWLHWAQFAADTRDAPEPEQGGLVLYELLRGSAAGNDDPDVAGTKASDNAAEWMYTLGDVSAQWDHYNTAGRVFLKEGSMKEARCYLQQNHVDVETVASFEAAAAAAEVVTFYPRSARPTAVEKSCTDIPEDTTLV
eukprot:TRINITY_DN1640_c3_g1_i1.p1 TRINITY_DN1640_c3_g1~~TRINITY_DN1640_c3_g1_i1.p1  ORF type:complete len:644 (+),score=132.86 TRINITY_DN1640_c3_g1_i1:63-1994(+)